MKDLQKVLEKASRQGNAFITLQELIDRASSPSRPEPLSELDRLAEAGTIYIDGDRLYLSQIWKQEVYAAARLRDLLTAPPCPAIALPSELRVDDMILSAEQRAAIATALSHRLSLILAGAGTGKTTLIRAMVEHAGTENILLCSPTGKAAKNLRDRIGFPALTVHRALGVKQESDFLHPASWDNVDFVIIDEASMLTLDMFAGILRAAPENCRIVLVGDPNQLLSVGAGDIVNDLASLGFPCSRLTQNHRQRETTSALCRNVTRYDSVFGMNDLEFDESFVLHALSEERAAMDTLAHHAASAYLTGGSVQVIALRNTDVDELNSRIQYIVNPPVAGKPRLALDRVCFFEGDRVMLTRNDRNRGCWNGEIGVFHIWDNGFLVDLEDGRQPSWTDDDITLGLASLRHAYAITVHKAQGSEYDTVYVYLTPNCPQLLNRNLLYTAISRAKKKLLLYGAPAAVDLSLLTPPPNRASALVERVMEPQ